MKELNFSKNQFAFTNLLDSFYGTFCDKTGLWQGDNLIIGEIEPLTDKKLNTVTPFGATNQDKTFHLSLLFEQNVLYVSSKDPFLINNAFGAKKPDDDPQVVDINDKAKKTKKIEPPVDREWRLDSSYDIKVLTCGTGVAIASKDPFEWELKSETLKITPRACCYIGFGKSRESAAKEAYDSIKNDAFAEHSKKIKDFLELVTLDLGDETLTNAASWARFSAYELCTKDEKGNLGLWAGLPWFRDNWGRDTFISLCGALLTSGEFQKAKEVLLGFAQFQDLDIKSPTYGRIPNRYRGADDVIYNTADGTLFFIRAVREYISYSGDKKILFKQAGNTGSLYDVLKRAVEADLKRCDVNGFLLCEEADTWMDARVKGNEALSPRADKAVDIEALWWTALLCAADFAGIVGDYSAADYYNNKAKDLAASFNKHFVRADYDMVADHLPRGEYGFWAPDLRVRPNQIFAITAPMAVKNRMIDRNTEKLILKNVDRELVTDYGLWTVAATDPFFHAHHTTNSLHHKDAAYHNGTIWPWNSGPYISATKDYNGALPPSAQKILINEANLILDGESSNSCAGSLCENIHAVLDDNGQPIKSGTYSQCWSLAEFLRNIHEDIFGIHPMMDENKIILKPALLDKKDFASIRVPLGCGIFSLSIKKSNNKYQTQARYDKITTDEKKEESKAAPQDDKITIIYTCDKIEKELSLSPGKSVEIMIDYPSITNEIALQSTSGMSYNEEKEREAAIRKEKIFHGTLKLDYWGSEKKPDYLTNLVMSGRLKSLCCAGENTAALEWWFDSPDFDKKFETNEPLGFFWSESATDFSLWAPTAERVQVRIQKKDSNEWESHELILGEKGVWKVRIPGNLEGVKYKYALMVHGVFRLSTDPYGTACAENGKVSVVYDKSKTAPSGWEDVTPPVLKTPCEAVITELHIADVTSKKSWRGEERLRKTFLGASESGVLYNDMPTGFDYIKALGVTHIQVLPIFDFSTVDDEGSRNQFNWGYDPRNYGCLKGFYSTNPSDPLVRIEEFKEFVARYARAGIGVIMDVVFNHVCGGLHTSLGEVVPGYYFRVEGYSGAGEDTASEHSMVRHYIVDMMKFWLKEYKLCGFRFDLMGLHDVKTLNEVTSELKKIKSDVLIYGEGWDMYRAGKMTPASMCCARLMPNVGHFNDAVRCAIKGPCNDDQKPGFIHTGAFRENIKAGIVGFTPHPQVDNTKVDLTANRGPWSDHSYTSLNYTEIHDNMTMFDKMQLVEPGKTSHYYEQLAKMAISLVILSEGIPIMELGQEALRTKQIPVELLDKRTEFCSDQAQGPDHRTFYLRNSYNAPDLINGIDWGRVYDRRGLVEYVKLLIKLRREHPAFKQTDSKVISKTLKFIDSESANLPKEVLAWCIDGAALGDEWHSIFIIANPKNEPVGYTLPINSVFTSGEEGRWRVATNGEMFCPKDCLVKIVDGAQFVLVQEKTVSVFYTLDSK